MINGDHFRRLERMYLAAPVNELYQPSIEISQGHAVVEFIARPEFFHAAQALHGAVYFKALDDAAFFAVSSVVEEFFVLTASFEVEFTRPVTKGLLHSEGRVLSSGGGRFTGEASLTVGDELVARGSGRFVRSRTRLSEALGYR